MHSAEGIKCVEVFLFLEVCLKYSVTLVMAIREAIIRQLCSFLTSFKEGGEGSIIEGKIV